MWSTRPRRARDGGSRFLRSCRELIPPPAKRVWTGEIEDGFWLRSETSRTLVGPLWEVWRGDNFDALAGAYGD
jgi:hypothetical protein